MNSPKPFKITWKEFLDVFEKTFPKSYDYFYDFHSFYGLSAEDISPCERLLTIGNYIETDYERLVSEMKIVACHICDIVDDESCNLEFSDDFVFLDVTCSDPLIA